MDVPTEIKRQAQDIIEEHIREDKWPLDDDWIVLNEEYDLNLYTDGDQKKAEICKTDGIRSPDYSTLEVFDV